MEVLSGQLLSASRQRPVARLTIDQASCEGVGDVAD